MRKPTTLWTTALAVAALILSAFAATANAQVNTEPPGVARLSFLRGDVSLQRGDSGDTSVAELNTPLVPGDRLFTGFGSRAEIQLDWANLLRLDENAVADIATLDQNRIQVQLAQGLAFFSVLKGSEADVEIDTPNVAINPRREGRYRIEVLPSGDTLVTVRDGEADISTPDGSTLLQNNQLITVRGTGSDVQFQIVRAPSSDEFDRWNGDRDRIIANAESYRRTNRYYTGASDLDAYGRWDRVPDYGYVWVPRVTAGWAPYRHGRWVWTAYWGWTWTSYEPWGWAPYHYGRWFVHGGNWVWWPGPVTPAYRPVYAPAYVSFFGFGSHSGFSVGVSFGGGFGSIGWLPAGPCDYVNPWWGRHRNTFNVVNVTNITNVYNVHNVNVIRPLRGGNRDSNVYNVFRNDRVRHGLSTVDAGNFGRGRANVRNVSASELRQGRFLTGNVPVAPSRESLRTSDRTVVAGASRSQTQQRFFSRRMPSTQRESFSDESARVQQAINRDGFGASPNRNAGNRPANTGGFGNRNGNTAAVNSQRQAPQAPRQAQTPAARSDSSGGWRRFGGGQTATGSTSNTQPQREPVLRAPRQRSTVSEASPNRPERQAVPSRPVQNQDRSGTTQPGFQRFSGRRSAGSGSNARQFVAQNDTSSQKSGSQAQQDSSKDRPSIWQRFTGGARSSSSNSSGGNDSKARTSSPSNDTRPQLQLNRPIIRLRNATPSRNSGASRGTTTAPRSNQRVTPAPRSNTPSPSSRGTAQRSAPSTNSRAGFGSRSAPSSSNSRGRASQSSQRKR